MVELSHMSEDQVPLVVSFGRWDCFSVSRSPFLTCFQQDQILHCEQVYVHNIAFFSERLKQHVHEDWKFTKALCFSGDVLYVVGNEGACPSESYFECESTFVLVLDLQIEPFEQDAQ